MKISKRDLKTYGEYEYSNGYTKYLVVYNDYDYIKPRFEIKTNHYGYFMKVYDCTSLEQAESFINLHTCDYCKTIKTRLNDLFATVENNYATIDIFIESVLSTDGNDKRLKDLLKDKNNKIIDIMNQYI